MQHQQQMNTSYFRLSQGATADRQPVEEPQQMQHPPLRKTGAAKSQQQGAQQLQQPLPDQTSSLVEIQAALLPSSSLPLTEGLPSQSHPPSEPEDETQSEAASSGQSISGIQELPNQAEGPLSDPDDARRAAETSTAETALPESYGDESTSITEDMVMEDAIRTTWARLRRTRTGKQIDV